MWGPTKNLDPIDSAAFLTLIEYKQTNSRQTAMYVYIDSVCTLVNDTIVHILGLISIYQHLNSVFKNKIIIRTC